MEARVNMSNQQFFVERYKQLGQEWKDVEDKIALRVNTLKISQEDLLKRLELIGANVQKIPFAKEGYWVKKSKFSLGAITEFLLGYYYLQEAASQIPVQILAPKEGEVVLDCCAAPGGKTTQIAQYMNNGGQIIALESKNHRMQSLKSSLERIGVENCVAYLMDAKKMSSLRIQFDKILLDAPCSGNYVTDRRWFEKRNIKGMQENAKVQRELLKEAVKSLKIGGVLVYSTCSLEPEENELNMDWALKNLPIELQKTELQIGDEGLTEVFGQKLNEEIKKCRRFWPWKTRTEGFFIAKIVKK